MLNLLCTVPGPPRQESSIGMLEGLDEMVLSPIVQALSGDDDEVISRVEFQEIIMGELCISSSIGCEVVQNRDQEEVLLIKGGNGGEKTSHDEKNSKFNISSSLVCELEDKGQEVLFVESNCEEKMRCDVKDLENHIEIRNNLVRKDEISSIEQICLDENSVVRKIDQEEGNNENLENSLVGTTHDILNGEFDDYKSCASDVEGKETENEEHDSKNVNLETFFMQRTDSNVSNGGEKLELGSIIRESSICNRIEERLTKSILTNRREHARTLSQGLQREGSLRVEREWKRTLACKLYEERITTKLREERSVPIPVKEGEGEEEDMDLLWEAIEVNSNKSDGHKNGTKVKGKKEVDGEDETGDDEGEEDDGPVRQLCCLQAFRVSTRKMNLGVGRPNLVKLSKVFRKMSVFHVGRNSSKISEEKEIGVIKG